MGGKERGSEREGEEEREGDRYISNWLGKSMKE